jgi:hypothetical protein
MTPRQETRCAAGFRSDLCPQWVIHDRGGQSHKFMSVRFAPKATVADQNVIRRFVPYRNSDG